MEHERCVCMCLCVMRLNVRDSCYSHPCRLHLETSSVLIRQLPVEALKKPDNWPYAPPVAGSSHILMLLKRPLLPSLIPSALCLQTHPLDPTSSSKCQLAKLWWGNQQISPPMAGTMSTVDTLQSEYFSIYSLHITIHF